MSRKLQPGQYTDPKGVVIEGNTPLLGLLGQFAGVPTTAISGYEKGALAVDSTNGNLYQNTGTTSSTTWTQMTSAGAFTVTNMTRSAAAATDTFKANTAAAWTITDGTTSMMVADTRNTIADVSAFVFRAAATTIATAAAAHSNPVIEIPARTITYTGTNTVTSSLGVMFRTGIPTFTDASAGTLSLASAWHVAAVAAAGGSLTLTAARMISTSVTDCYLTNAGVWTDTACWEAGKELVVRGLETAREKIDRVLDAVVPATWRYKAETELPSLDSADGVHRTKVDDFGRDRVGIVYDDLPGELRAPGEERGVSAGILASFALAALRLLRDENRQLEARLVAAGI